MTSYTLRLLSKNCQVAVGTDGNRLVLQMSGHVLLLPVGLVRDKGEAEV